MTRLVMSGFEAGDTLQAGADVLGSVGTTPSVTVVTATPTARSGTYCLKCVPSTAGLSGGQSQWTGYCARKAFAHASKTELWYAFGFYSHHVSEASSAPAFAFFVTKDTAGNINTYLTHDGGIIRAYVATAGGATPTVAQSTLIAAASMSTSVDAWHLIEVRLAAATGSTGNCEVYVDGVSLISTSSQRTAQTNANFGSFDIGFIAQALVGAAGTGYHAFDDVRLNDTSGSINNGRPGDGRIIALIPNGVGTTIGGTPLTPSTGATNWQLVDELPPSATDYNSGSATGTGETYALGNTTGVTACQAINVIAYALNADGGGGNIGITVKTGAGTSEGSAQAITGTATYYTRLLETDPSDSAAWTSVKLDALEAGITVR